MSINQNMLAMQFKIPPSRADISVVGPLTHVSEIQNGLFQMGLTADDLQPLDWRNGTISDTRNQQNCGDCWAMSSTSVLQDRFMIQKGFNNLSLEPAVTAQCCANPNGQTDTGCNGGQPFLAGQFFENNGLPEISDNCPSWSKICTATSCTLPTCQQIQQECSNPLMYKATQGSTKNLTATNGTNIDKTMTIINIKRELVNGPVVACFFVPTDFMASAGGYLWDKTNGIFVNGAYNDILDQTMSAALKSALGNPSGAKWQDIMMENGSPAGHAVEIVGWDSGDAGSSGTVSFWIVRNSWGSTWGENGFFKIAMNDDSNNNKYLGFDIPVTTLTVASTGQTTNIGGMFGGTVSFDPNLSTGKAGNGPQSVPLIKKKSMLYIVGIIIAVLIILIILYYIMKKKY